MVSKSTTPAQATAAAKPAAANESSKAESTKAQTHNTESGKVSVEVIAPFYGVDEDRALEAGTKISVDAARAESLRQKGLVK